jgi:hypothetical protein
MEQARLFKSSIRSSPEWWFAIRQRDTHGLRCIQRKGHIRTSTGLTIVNLELLALWFKNSSAVYWPRD